MNILKYKGYQAKVEYSAEDKMLYGTIIGINDLIDFATENASEIEEEFHKAVDGYIEFCNEVGKKPEKTCSGSFNVRMTPELHREAVMAAATHGITLNQFITNATKAAVANS